jgi:hypothetical protein
MKLTINWNSAAREGVLCSLRGERDADEVNAPNTGCGGSGTKKRQGN